MGLAGDNMLVGTQTYPASGHRKMRQVRRVLDQVSIHLKSLFQQ